MICADLANRSKHIELNNKRLNAKITGFGVTIYLPTSYTYNNQDPDKPYAQEIGYTEHPFYIEVDSGKKLDGLSIAIHAVDDWKKILSKYSLSLT